MRAGIDLTEVETRTKIRARYLRAIENEDWDLLPAEVYAKSYLRAYGDFLGLDSRLLVDEFKRRYEHPPDHEIHAVAALHRERERAARGPLLPSWAVIGLVLVAIVVVLYILGSGAKTKNAPPTGLRGRPHHVNPHPVRHAPAPPAAAPKPQTATLQLVPTSTLYVCLVNGRGTPLISGQTFAPGQTIPTETAQKLLLTIGNNAVQMKVNGNPVNVSASSSSIGFQITSSGASPLPASKQPTCR